MSQEGCRRRCVSPSKHVASTSFCQSNRELSLKNTAASNNRALLWRELAKHVPGRSNKDCRRRWWNCLAGVTARGPWLDEEDARLIAAVNKHGQQWNQIALLVGSRNADQCSSHWRQVLDPAINFADWTPEEVKSEFELQRNCLISILHRMIGYSTQY